MNGMILLANDGAIETAEALKEYCPRVPYKGYVYIIQWGTDKVKIGCTSTPINRIPSVIRLGKLYGGVNVGQIAISEACTNFKENEKALHEHFKEARCNSGELFDIRFEQAVHDAVSVIKIEDRSDELKKQTDEGVEKLKSLTGKMFGFENSESDGAIPSLSSVEVWDFHNYFGMEEDAEYLGDATTIYEFFAIYRNRIEETKGECRIGVIFNPSGRW